VEKSRYALKVPLQVPSKRYFRRDTDKNGAYVFRDCVSIS